METEFFLSIAGSDRHVMNCGFFTLLSFLTIESYFTSLCLSFYILENKRENTTISCIP